MTVLEAPDLRVVYVPDVAVAIAGVAIADDLVVADLTIRSGRSRADDGVSPATATIELLSATPGGVSISIGDALVVTVDGGPRFTGRVSEITRAATTGSSSGTTWTVVGAGGTSRMARILVPMPRPAESAAARASAILTAAGYVPDIRGGEGVRMAALGATGDPPQALDSMLNTLAGDTGCVIADQPDGSILVQFLDSRLSDDRFTPDPAQTHVAVEWVQSDDLANDVTVTWPGGSQEASNPASIARWDPHTVSLTTGLGDALSAGDRAQSMVARLAVPVWECGAVQTWDPGALEHGIGALVTLAPLPASAPVSGGTWDGVLEGWTDHYAPAADGSGQLGATWDLALSDRRHSSETVVWRNVSPETLQWRQVLAATAWQDAVSNDDLSNLLAEVAG